MFTGLVKLSELKAPPFSLRSFPVDDGILISGVRGDHDEEVEEEDVTPAVRRRNRKSSPTEGGEEKVRGRRQRDFDPTAVDEEEAEPQEIKEKAVLAVWTQNQQKLLELALQQFPRGTAERWDRIAKVVPGKTKVRTETLL